MLCLSSRLFNRNGLFSLLSDMLLPADSKIKIYEGARNNFPDKDSQRAATEIQNLVTSLRENDILLVLISGGGSALLPTPMDPITLEEEAELTKRISASGATIGELNCIRKHIETLKGGGLAELAFPAKVVSLILSDAIGDDLDIIASGPTVRDTSSPHQCLHILQSLGLTIPRSITMTVEKAAASLKSSNDMNTILQNVQNVLLGNNKLVTDGASIKATESNFVSFVLTNTLDGEARKCGEVFGKLAKYLCLSFELAFQRSNRSSSELSTLEIELVQSGLMKATLNELVYVVNKAYNKEKDICIISGGETTVAVKGDGKGGRNQELALATAIELDKLFSDSDLAAQFSVSFLSGGTDGQDGPTDAAGAVIDNAFVETCLSEKYDPVQYLHNNDSYNLFSNVSSGKHLLKIGLTGTNVMDIQLLAIRKRK